MKTILEKQFDRAVITSICTKEISIRDRIDLLTEFLNHNETYYDNLCDALLALSTRQNILPVWMTPGGNSYLSLEPRNPDDRVLVYPEEVPLFDIDLVEQLEVAILKI